MSNPVNDVDSIPLEELRKLANSANETVEEGAQPTGEPDRVIYTRKIDIGDGAGVQVFEAESLEELVDKLAVAQEHASRKIRELAHTKTVEKPPAHKAKEYTPDEEFVISQEMMANPSKAFKTMFKDMTGISIEDFSSTQAAMAEFKRQQDNLSAQEVFVSRHPEYVGNQSNGRRLIEFIHKYLGGNMTLENMETAFSELGGLLELKDATTADDTTNEPTTAQRTSRIVKPADESRDEEVVIQRKRVASGLPARGRTAVPAVRTQGPTEDELETMPLDKLRDLANRELRKG